MGLAELIFGICRNRSRLEMYDVNFGGIEQMTKRLTIALVALAMFVLVAVVPVSASFANGYYTVAQNIGQGATVFIGEQGLNITPALASANTAGGTVGTFHHRMVGISCRYRLALHQRYPLTQLDERLSLP